MVWGVVRALTDARTLTHAVNGGDLVVKGLAVGQAGIVTGEHHVAGGGEINCLNNRDAVVNHFVDPPYPPLHRGDQISHFLYHLGLAWCSLI